MYMGQFVLVTTALTLWAALHTSQGKPLYGKLLPEGKSLSLLRQKRAASDQRMAELQALVALANSGPGRIGHGKFDLLAAGKRSGGSMMDAPMQDEYTFHSSTSHITPITHDKLRNAVENKGGMMNMDELTREVLSNIEPDQLISIMRSINDHDQQLQQLQYQHHRH